ncbi:hypothetical protein [Streptomyces sviceus]|uniref:hypothetical protein n=1 Tax=Streptomyces sviceus TaxID=285530 RepID=UPI003689C280
MRFSAGWAGGDLEYSPVSPERVAEFQGDTAVDDGHYRHPVRFVRLREDVVVKHVPHFGA